MKKQINSVIDFFFEKLSKNWFTVLILWAFFFSLSEERNHDNLYSFVFGGTVSIILVSLVILRGWLLKRSESRAIAKRRVIHAPEKKLEKNPIYLYMGQPCAVCDTDQPVSDFIEGCDFYLDQIIAERVNCDPDIIKPILRDISDMTNEEALEVANMVWWALGNKKIKKVDVKRTTLFPHAAIYFDWSPDQDIYDNAEDKKEFLRVSGEIKTDKFIISLDNDHHTIKLFKVDNEDTGKMSIMQVYQSHKITLYLIQKGFDLGLLKEGSYLIRNNSHGKDNR